MFEAISLLISLIAVMISLATLQQNKKMVEEANRPYLVVYYDNVQTLSDVFEYIVLKNFGKTGAVIDYVTVDPPVKYWDDGHQPFCKMKNTFVAPGQVFTTELFNTNFPKPPNVETRTYTIQYRTDSRTYKETYIINETMLDSSIYAKPVPDVDLSVQQVLASSATELFRRSL
ncbi:MAG: hypothetical protein ACLUDL_06500 [Eubacterium callanderi]|uniref:hypothetical protein n=1 Tax=Eubacterium callanderi TaxID=53442 RepID=UPI003995C854